MKNLSTASPSDDSPRIMPLLTLGFRPFFICAALYAVVSVVLWAGLYFGKMSLPATGVSIIHWHAHEMIYGYALAVIAGFLLTATQNWTNIDTLRGAPLLLLAGLWAAARSLFFSGELQAAAVADTLFTLWLAQAVTTPIVRAGQWMKLAIVSKLLLLLAANLLFYLGALGVLDNGVYWGLYGGLYLVIGLILMIGRMVLPFFTELGVGYPVKLRQSRILDITSMVLFLLFFVGVLFQYEAFAAVTALGLFLVNAARLLGWHTAGIWRKPLLWILYLAMCFICLGFLLHAVAHFGGMGMLKLVTIHAFAYGGIGLMTLGMMARVTLGHTGRNVHAPPSLTGAVFGVLLAGAVVRVFPPLFAAQYYPVWVGLSQTLWAVAFAGFLYLFLPMLLSKNKNTS